MRIRHLTHLIVRVALSVVPAVALALMVAPRCAAQSAQEAEPASVAGKDSRDGSARRFTAALEQADDDALVQALEAAAGGQDLNLDDQDVLSIAATLDSVRTVRVLIARGVPINGKDRKGETALFAAACAGARQTAAVLLALGADPELAVDSRRGHGWTPLFAATVEGHEDVVALLLAVPVQVDARDSFGRTPLFYAAFHGLTAVMDRLVSAGASTRSRDHGGLNPIAAAAMQRRSQDTQRLWKAGREESQEGATSTGASEADPTAGNPK